MEQLGSNLEGRLRNTDLPTTKCLFPIFEAVVNSIYAIDDRITNDSAFSMSDGRIRIIINRENKTDLFGDKPSISSITIEDNGIGFTDENYKSFCELDTMYRASLGCKGIGRLFWLKAFNSAEINSTFFSNGIHNRHFFFTAQGIKEVPEDTDEEDRQQLTVIKLNGINAKFKEPLNRLTQEGIAKAIFEHCLWFFLRKGSCPDIRVIDGDNVATNLNEIYDSYMCSKDSESSSFTINGHTFNVLHVRLQRAEKNNIISYCAGNRIVTEEKIKDIVGLYDSAIQTDDESFFYKSFVTSDFLDEHVSADRFSFVIPENNEQDSNGDSMFKEICFSDIRSKVNEAIRCYISPFLKNNIEAGKEKIINYVDTKAPYYKPIFDSLTNDEKIVNPNSTDKSIDLYLHQKMVEKEHDLINEGHDVLTVRAGESKEEYIKRTNNYIDGIQQLKQSDLARYVLHRKLILELLKDALEVKEDGHYSREEKIHQIIMPMHTTSDTDDFSSNNLWIVDERLVFHHYLASDKSFSSMKVTDSESTKRPDILVENIYNTPFIVSDKDNPPFATLRIVEFKRPMRDDMEADDSSKNPIDQCIDYVEKIRSGNTVTKNGRPINISEDIPAYCYVICDLTPSMQSVCKKHDLRKTYDSLGYFGYKNELKIYFEVISFDQLLNSANERNASFFDKLGLPHN